MRAQLRVREPLHKARQIFFLNRPQAHTFAENHGIVLLYQVWR
jgi:hypothetical protein